MSIIKPLFGLLHFIYGFLGYHRFLLSFCDPLAHTLQYTASPSFLALYLLNSFSSFTPSQPGQYFDPLGIGVIVNIIIFLFSGFALPVRKGSVLPLSFKSNFRWLYVNMVGTLFIFLSPLFCHCFCYARKCSGSIFRTFAGSPIIIIYLAFFDS